MSDVLARLRSGNVWLNEGSCCGQVDADGRCFAPACIRGDALKMFKEAADEIERLRAALAAARPVIRAQALEEAARFIEGHTPRYDDANKGFLVKRMAFDSIGLPYAAAIRALKEKE